MTAAERARNARAGRALAGDAADRIEVTFWPLLDLEGALSDIRRLLNDLPHDQATLAAAAQASLDKAREATEAISIALWDGAMYGRRQRAYQKRYKAVSFLSLDIDQMKAEHAKRLEEIAARTGAGFILRDGRITAMRTAEERAAPKATPSRKT